jgi:ferredoxin/predicted metal-dependent enzyme (double-stranded beta helix superfamily)
MAQAKVIERPKTVQAVQTTTIADRRTRACEAVIQQARKIIDQEGSGEASLMKIKALLVDLAAKGDALFPQSDFALPVAQARNHVLVEEDGDGLGLYLTIGLPGKEAAPHCHGIWCVNASLAGRELHQFYRRTDDGTRPGYAMVEEIGQSLVTPGLGMIMMDQSIHATKVLGDEPAWGLALYGYALTRFPSVLWFVPEFCSVRATPSRRDALASVFVEVAPQECCATSFKVTIANTGQTIDCEDDSPILCAAIAAGIDYPYACASGNCATCISELKSGEVTMLPYGDGALSLAQQQDGKILACRAQPQSDVEIMWLGRGRR